MKDKRKEGYIAAFSFILVGTLIWITARNQGMSTIQGQSLWIIGVLLGLVGIGGVIKPEVAEVILHYLKNLVHPGANSQNQKQIKSNSPNSSQIMTGQGDIHVHNTSAEAPAQSHLATPSRLRVKGRLEEIKGEASRLKKEPYDLGEASLDRLKKETKQIIRNLHPQDSDATIRNMFSTLAVYTLSSLQDKESRQSDFVGNVNELITAVDVLISEVNLFEQ